MTLDGATLERFWKYVEKSDDCWLWKGALTAAGYGVLQVKVAGTWKAMGAHRISYHIHKGAIAQGLSVCHTCDVRNCLNPAHLWLGTRGDNVRDAAAKGRMPGPSIDQRGVLNPSAVLSETEVISLLADHRSGALGPKKLAQKYGVSQTTVWKITTGQGWKHMQAPA